MKILSVIFLLLSVNFVVAQEINQFDAQGERHGKWMKTYEGTDHIRYRGTFEHGKEVGTFAFFKLPEEENKKEKEAPHPFATKTYSVGSDFVEMNYFTPKGNLLSSGKMNNQQRTGKWVYYHPDSEKIMRVEHYENGKLSGEQIIYFKNGNITKKSHYKNGILNGITQIYAENGTLLKHFTYQNGELNGAGRYYNSNGDLILEGTYRNNLKDGVWKSYKNGKVVKTEEYPIH